MEVNNYNNRILTETDSTTLNNNIYISLTFIVFLISIITTIGGIGGGGLLIPTYVLLGGFTIREAIPLSIFTILGDCAIRVCILYYKKHPLSNKRYLIEITPLLLIIPFDGNTSFIGVIMSETFPPLLSTICIIIVLGYTFIRSVNKALTTYIKETENIEKQNNNIIVIDGIAEYFPHELIRDVSQSEEEDPDNEKIGDSIHTKHFKTCLCVGTTLILASFSIGRSYLYTCGYTYWILVCIQFILISCIGYYIANYILTTYNTQRNTNYLFLPCDIVWDQKNINRFIGIGTITGVLSSYMGIGGGMMITPVMIEAGMMPEVVVATSAVTTFFSSLISSINYYVQGELIIEYAGVFALASAIGSFTGYHLSCWILNHFKRQSIIIFVVAIVLFTSVILLTVNSFTDNSNNFYFNNLCKK
jgi:uncharacterized membrane protein YfcA